MSGNFVYDTNILIILPTESRQVLIMKPGVPDMSQLQNCYFAMRHGQSDANHKSIIVSDPKLGINSYGLTQAGREQVRSALEQRPPMLDEQLKIISSDFLRARQTADILATGLAVTERVRYSEKLRERFFGRLDGQPDSRYREVWKHDSVDATHSEFGVEPVTEVMRRTLSLLSELEASFQDAMILLVSHGDVLQILQTAFDQMEPTQHRQLTPLQVAQIRMLTPVSQA